MYTSYNINIKSQQMARGTGGYPPKLVIPVIEWIDLHSGGKKTILTFVNTMNVLYYTHYVC